MVAALVDNRLNVDLEAVEFLPPQNEARDLVEQADGPEWVLLSGGMGAGKTYWLCWQGLRLHFLNVQHVVRNGGTPDEVWGLILSATHGLLKKAVLVTLMTVMAEAGLKYGRDYTINRSEGILRFAWGGGMYMFSAERPENIIAVTVSYALIDEPGTPKKGEALFRVKGRLRGKGSHRKIAMAGTPEDIISQAWFYEFIASPESMEKHGGAGDNTRRVVFADTRQNVFLENLSGFVRGMEGVYTKQQQDAYVGGKFVAFNLGRVYSGFIDRDQQLRGHTVKDGDDALKRPSRGNPLIISLDFNVDPMCGVVCWANGQDGLTVVDEIRIPKDSLNEGETPISRWCDELIHRWAADWMGPLHIYGDATEAKQTVAASMTGWQMVHNKLRPVMQDRGLDYMVGVWASNPPEKDRVNTVNNAFEEGRIVVAHRCLHLRRDLNLVGFKEGTTQIDKSDPSLTHLSDALGYAIVQRTGYVSARSGGTLPPVVTPPAPDMGALYDWGT